MTDEADDDETGGGGSRAHERPATSETVVVAPARPSRPRVVDAPDFGPRYRVTGVLGRGGMGEVYRAFDAELGEDVALKVVRSDIASVDSVGRLRREIALSRRVSDPNVLRVHDLGEHAGLPFLSMELVDGESLSDLLEREGTLPRARALAVFRMVAKGLAAAHAEGVVHRDLKPHNVLIDKAGRVRVADFGLARSIAESGMTAHGAVLGSPAYMAPEQVKGDPVDARADIYSLGILLYQLVTGQTPFQADTAHGVMVMRLHKRPRPMRELVPDTPPYLDEIVSRCLAVEPADRYASVASLLADLDAAATPAPPPLATMKPALHGRVTEVDAICATFDGVRRRSAITFALVGEPGIGKTRLAEEVTERAARVGFACHWGRAWEAGGAPAYFPWRSLLDSLGVARSGALAMLWGKGGAAATDLEQARFDLFDAVASELRTATASGPLVCVLDDLHAADLPSLELALFVTRHLRSHPILWLVTWRDSEAATAPGKDLIAAIARGAQALALRRLTAGETRGMLDDLVARGMHEDLRRESGVDELLFRATAGNPLFIVETLACLTTRGLSGIPSELGQLPLTEGVAAVVRARMASLSPAARRAVEAASLLGRELALDRWAEAADIPEELLRERAREIVASGIFAASGPALWTFCHDLVREAIVREVPADFARAAHRRIALALDGRIAASERPLAEARLHHGLAALGAMDAATVLGWAVEASDAARAQCAYEQSLALVQHAVSVLGPRVAMDARLQLALGRAQLDVGNVSAARQALHAAIDAAKASGDARTRALSVLAFGSRYVLGDIHDDLVRMIDDASVALGDGDDVRDLRARLLARKAAALTPAEKPDEVLAWARDALRMVATSTDDEARLDVCVGVGSAFGDFAHPRERIPVNEELVRVARVRRDRALELRGLSRLVTDHLEAGDLRRADMLLPERDELARSLERPRFAWMAPLFRSMRAMAEGRFDVCRAAVADAETCAQVTGDANAARAIAVHRTWLFLLQDDVEALREHEPRVLEALRSMPLALPAVVRASIRVREGKPAAARDEVAAISTALPHCAVNTMVTLAEVVAEVGPPELAHALIARLSAHADTFAIWGLFALTCGVPVATALGSLEAAFGDPVRAREHFERALERTTAGNLRALRAWTRFAYGRALLGPLADRERGQAMLAEAADEAAALDMPGLARRCAEVGGAQDANAARSEPESTLGDWILRREATAWCIDRTGRSMLVPALRGMPMIARLTQSPDTEIHSLELVTGTPATDREAGDAGEMLDDKTRAAYRRRAAELADKIEEAEERGDADRVDIARSELEALGRELARAVGRGGRTRRAGAAVERARVSAQRRIREAIKKIAEVDPELADHLGHTITTGIYCLYAPRRKRA